MITEFLLSLKKNKKAMIVLLFFILISRTSFAQSRDENLIHYVLQSQANAWNKGNLETYMKGYWNNDSVIFIGKSGITYGWQKTLENYKKAYPDTSAMGKLAFHLLQLKPLSSGYYFVVGKWYLKRTTSDLEGIFTLLFKKINGKWLIVADHSS